VAYVNPAEKSQQKILTKSSPPDGVVKTLDQLFERNNTKALLVAQGDELIYEKYSFGTGRRSTPLGYSMSKSLTALTVGKALCDGHISSINDPIKKYVPALINTSWGDSSIRDVLRMSSGAYETLMSMHGHKNLQHSQALGQSEHLGKMYDDYTDLMRMADERKHTPGKEFNYSNLDTIALGLLIQGSTQMSFPAYFEKSIWQPAGTQSKGAWFINHKKQTSTYQGFSASPEDWIRIGIMVLDQLKNQDDCFGKFTKEATSKQINSFGPAPSYGYQIWVNCGSAKSDFCFVGYGGQYLVFNVEKKIVLYYHATTFSQGVGNTPSIMSELISNLESAP
jgi:CubicO group peptidase (beta-lactamase class C family)